MNNDFKKLFIKIAKFVAIFLVIDFALGFVAKKVYFSQESGKCARISYTIEQADEDIIIFGSSQAIHHIIPEIITDSTGKTCYNSGVRGQELLFNHALQKLILERTQPKLLILNVDGYWLYESRVFADRLSTFHPYYQDNKKTLKPLLAEHNNFIEGKLFFKGYQYNSTIIHAIKYLLAPQTDFNGYMPLYGVLEEKDITGKASVTLSDLKIDPYLEKTFENFILEAKNKNVPMVLSITPSLWGKSYSDDKSMKRMLELAEKYDVPVLDFAQQEEFTLNYKLFNDYGHLNDSGARVFTPILASRLIELGY